MIVPMKKITFVGLEAEKERFLQRLQDVGLAHVIQPREPAEPADLVRQLQRVTDTHKFLSRKGEKGKPEQKLSAEEICARREEIAQEEARLHAEITGLRKQRATAEPWGDFSVEDVKQLREKGVQIQFFRVARRNLEELSLGDTFHHVVSERGGEVFFVTLAPARVDLGVAEEKLPERSLSDIDRAIAYNQAKLQEVEEAYAALAEHLDELERAQAELTDRVAYQRAILNARRELGERVFVLQAWSPVSEEELVSKVGDSFTYYHYSEAPRQDDRMPVLLKNAPAFESGEDLVRVYSYPSDKDFDPSPFVLYCFAVFFGMIVSDLGYGLVLLGLTFWLRKKIPSRSPMAIRMFRLMFILCGTVMFFGIISAGFFGIELAPDNPWMKNAWFKYGTTEGQNQVMVVSILMGMAHISLSMLIKLYNDRDYSALGWVIAIWSSYFLINSNMKHGTDNPPAMYCLIAGLAVVLLFSSKSRSPLIRLAEGLQGLVGIIQIFSDVLSYLRLFALGIATVYIAQTFNILGGSVSEAVPVVGVVFAGIILLFGHVLNLGLAIMGGVIHGLRLNFLEWYRWCFEGDGLEYKPFQRISEQS